eukprot:COSAG01_NODE_9167_length_2531_cov_3.107319_2_plen_153_part_00
MTHLARVTEVTGCMYSRCLRTFSCEIVRTDIMVPSVVDNEIDFCWSAASVAEAMGASSREHDLRVQNVWDTSSEDKEIDNLIFVHAVSHPTTISIVIILSSSADVGHIYYRQIRKIFTGSTTRASRPQRPSHSCRDGRDQGIPRTTWTGDQA